MNIGISGIARALGGWKRPVANGRREGSRHHRAAVRQGRAIVYVLGVALMTTASFATMANERDRLFGAHEVPSFVCDRVELVPGIAVDQVEIDFNRTGLERSVCARRTDS
jgi:hypothetical protein